MKCGNVVGSVWFGDGLMFQSMFLSHVVIEATFYDN